MRTTTKLKNPTDQRQHYGWVPRHGAWINAGETIEIKGDLRPKRPRARTEMNEDIASGRILVISEVDTEFITKPVAPAVEKKEAPAPKIEPKTVSKMGDTVMEEIILPPMEEDEEELNMPGIEIVDPDAKEPVFDHRGNEIEEEEPVILNNVADIDEDDILSKQGSIQLDGELSGTAGKKEEEEVEPVEEPTAEIPSKSAVKKMKADEVKDLAADLGMEITEDTTKGTATDYIDSLR